MDKSDAPLERGLSLRANIAVNAMSHAKLSMSLSLGAI